MICCTSILKVRARFFPVPGIAAPIVRRPGGRVHRREDVVLQSYKKLANRRLTPTQFHRARIHDIPRDAKGVSLCADYSVTLQQIKIASYDLSR